MMKYAQRHESVEAHRDRIMPQAKLRERVLAIARGDYRPKASDQTLGSGWTFLPPLLKVPALLDQRVYSATRAEPY